MSYQAVKRNEERKRGKKEERRKIRRKMGIKKERKEGTYVGKVV